MEKAIFHFIYIEKINIKLNLFIFRKTISKCSETLFFAIGDSVCCHLSKHIVLVISENFEVFVVLEHSDDIKLFVEVLILSS